MSCSVVGPPGGRAILCGMRGTKTNAKPCVYCHRPATHLCDHRVPDRTVKGWTFKGCTCDVPLCERCRTVAAGKDYCRDHAPKPTREQLQATQL
jgi:hypothetical protein